MFLFCFSVHEEREGVLLVHEGREGGNPGTGQVYPSFPSARTGVLRPPLPTGQATQRAACLLLSGRRNVLVLMVFTLADKDSEIKQKWPVWNCAKVFILQRDRYQHRLPLGSVSCRSLSRCKAVLIHH